MINSAPMVTGVFTKRTVIGGTTEVIPIMGAPLPFVVTANPLEGDTLTLSFSTDDGDNYQVWTAGTAGLVSVISAVIFDFPITHIQAVCTGTGTTSVVTVC